MLLQGWSFDIGKQIDVLFLGEDYLFWLPHSSVAFRFSLGLRLCGHFPLHFGMFIDVYLVHFKFEQSCWPDFICIDSDITRRHNLIKNLLMLWSLQTFCFLFFNVPWVMDAEVNTWQFVAVTRVPLLKHGSYPGLSRWAFILTDLKSRDLPVAGVRENLERESCSSW